VLQVVGLGHLLEEGGAVDLLDGDVLNLRSRLVDGLGVLEGGTLADGGLKLGVHVGDGGEGVVGGVVSFGGLASRAGGHPSYKRSCVGHDWRGTKRQVSRERHWPEPDEMNSCRPLVERNFGVFVGFKPRISEIHQ
jgi:hypothetical protein